MIELRDVVAVEGMRPLSARALPGELVALEGDKDVVVAVLEVISGQRRPLRGQVHMSDHRSVVLRDCDRWPPGIELLTGLYYYAAAHGGTSSERLEAVSSQCLVRGKPDLDCCLVARGLLSGATLWCMARDPRQLSTPAQRLWARTRDELRSGTGVVLLGAGSGTDVRVDRQWVVSGSSQKVPKARGSQGRLSPSAWAVLRLELQRLWRTPVLPIFLALGALLAAVTLFSASGYETYWYPVGSHGGVGVGVLLASAMACTVAGVSVAASFVPTADVFRETALGERWFVFMRGLFGLGLTLPLAVGLAPSVVWAMRGGQLSGAAAAVAFAGPLATGLVAHVACFSMYRFTTQGWVRGPVAVGSITLIVLIGLVLFV